MTGFEPGLADVDIDCSANCSGTATANFLTLFSCHLLFSELVLGWIPSIIFVLECFQE